MFSQNDEEKYILNYFGDFKGRFLDIGAFDGVNLSNTRELIERGWTGVMVEPSPSVFPRLVENTKEPGITLINAAIASIDGHVDFWDNDQAVATAVPSEMDRWEDQAFKKCRVPAMTVSTLLSQNPGPYHFISIDAEGMDYDILRQIKPIRLNCRMVCVEHNGKVLNECREYLYDFGYKVLLVNAENLIMVR